MSDVCLHRGRKGRWEKCSTAKSLKRKYQSKHLTEQSRAYFGQINHCYAFTASCTEIKTAALVNDPSGILEELKTNFNVGQKGHLKILNYWISNLISLKHTRKHNHIHSCCNKSPREIVIKKKSPGPGKLCHLAAGREAWRWGRREEGVVEEVINQGDSLHPGIPAAGKPTHILQGRDEAAFLYGPLLAPSSTSRYS